MLLKLQAQKPEVKKVWPNDALESRHVMDSIAKSNKRFTYESYLKAPEQYPEYDYRIISDSSKQGGLRYYRYFYKRGGLREEGLESDSKAGTWFYYDTSGVLYKEYNYNTESKKMYGMEKEANEWAFDSVSKLAIRFVKRHFKRVLLKKQFEVENI